MRYKVLICNEVCSCRRIKKKGFVYLTVQLLKAAGTFIFLQSRFGKIPDEITQIY